MSRTRRLIHTLSVVAALGAPLSAAVAQDSPPRDGGAEAAPAAPLQGPKVVDERAPGTDSRFSMGMERARESERPIPLRIYEQELRKLTAASMGESLRMSSKQQEAVRTIIQEHRRALRAFYAEHREEIAAIRGESASDARTDRAPRRDAPGADRGKPGASDRAPSGNAQDAKPGARTDRRGPANLDRARAMSPEAREKMQALRAKGPQESAAISKLWGVLNAEQRAHLTARFESIREANMRQREARKRAGESRDADARPASDALTPEQRRARRQRLKDSGQSPP